MPEPLSTPRLHDHLGRLVAEIPRLVSLLSVDEWNTLLKICNERAGFLYQCYSEEFIATLLEATRVLEPQGIRFCLEELVTHREVQIGGHTGSTIGIGTTVLRSLMHSYDTFTEPELTSLHTIFRRMYTEWEARYPKAEAHFQELKDLFEPLPRAVRSEGIRWAEELANFPKKKSSKYSHDEHSTIKLVRTVLPLRNRLLLGYARALKKNAHALGGRLSSWVEGALKKSKTLQELVDYFEDKEGYYKFDVEQVSQGLQFSQIHERLQTYARALAGGDIQLAVKEEETTPLACSFDKGTFFLPKVVNIASKEEENYRIYKALVSYQAAAVIFGTYSLDSHSLSDDLKQALGSASDEPLMHRFFSMYNNPEFTRHLFRIAEFSRLDTQLQARYPGLPPDLKTLKHHLDTQRTTMHGKRNDLEKLLKKLWTFTYTGTLRADETTPHGKLLHALAHEIQHASRGDGVAHTLNAVHRIYSLIAQSYDLSQEVPEPVDVLQFSLEHVIEKTSSTGYLVAEPSRESLSGKEFRYPEWDQHSGTYKPYFVRVVELEGVYLPQAPQHNGKTIIERNSRIIHTLREKFASLRPEEFAHLSKQLSGDVDYEAAVRARAELKLGITPSEQLYIRTIKNQRSVVAMILSEVSGSLGRFLDIKKPGERLIDTVNASNYFFAEALDALGDNYAVAMFSGETEKNVAFYLLKNFGEPYTPLLRDRLLSMRPLRQNRDGAGIRHASFQLSQQPEKTKLLICLMEGVPHDYGYEGAYALEDTKRAIIESKNHGCTPLVFAYGTKIDERMRSLADHALYREVRNPEELPLLIPHLYQKMTL